MEMLVSKWTVEGQGKGIEYDAEYLRTETGVNGRECVGIFMMSGFYNQ